MQVITGKAAPAKRTSMAHRFKVWIAMQRLNFLREETNIEWAEIDRAQARIEALDKEIQQQANDIALLQLKK